MIIHRHLIYSLKYVLFKLLKKAPRLIIRAITNYGIDTSFSITPREKQK